MSVPESTGEGSHAARERSAAEDSTGYGPRQVLATAMHGRGLLPRFDGDEARYHIWEARFLAYLKTIGLKDAILGSQQAGAADVEAAPDDGKKSLEILRRHFESEEKPRIVGLYTELTNVLMAEKEELADYLARVEKIVAALNRAKETLSDALLVAMVLKGLTDEYAPFSVHVTQTRETLSFSEFKARLRSFECSLRYRSRPRADEVMMINHKEKQTKYKNNEKKYFSGECFICEKVGHKARDCRNKAKKPQRNVRAAYTQNSSKAVAITDTRQSTTRTRDEHTAEQETFILRASEWQPHNTQPEGLLVDSGASAHIMTNEEAFIRFDETFRPKDHVMQLADGTRIAGSVLKKGDAQIKLTDSNGRVVSVQLTNALLIPGYPQNILSVEAAASKGAKFNFEMNNNKMILPNGTTCDMKKSDKPERAGVFGCTETWFKGFSTGRSACGRLKRRKEEAVKYQRGLQELRGRSCSELDTPEYRRVRRTQDSVSMAKYHEDFERARGRGFTPGLDDPSMERYQRANQMMGEAGYSKGLHSQGMEVDRRPGGIIVAAEREDWGEPETRHNLTSRRRRARPTVIAGPNRGGGQQHAGGWKTRGGRRLI
ncbi:hypothetical protein OJAV_G00201250 [Oryzias javanicus]|uniref:CCHC-type domain-containing protein n=1 Tax=Oryzias javanicus TaxID=123683 RepID=A0A3S2LQQ7_ORYJA|nr:hypothetical protein OJAV_G00201250 [Oryzias javanicus]